MKKKKSKKKTKTKLVKSKPAGVDLESVLEAWQTATQRLQQTHRTLSEEVRRLTDELEVKNRELARKNRLADLGQMASHVAHECRNSLMPIILYLSLLRRRLEHDGESIQIVEKIESGFTALEATVNDLLHFASDRDPDWCLFDVRSGVVELCDSLAPQLAAQGTELELQIEKSTKLEADKNMIRRTILNLVLNALDVMPNGGTLSIACQRTAGGVELTVADTGPGVSEEVHARLFEPFVTTKSEGTGLGLAIVERIAAVHGGEAACDNRADGGASFTLRIPNRVVEKAA